MLKHKMASTLKAQLFNRQTKNVHKEDIVFP